MDQVFVENVSKEDVKVSWDGQEQVVKAGAFVPTLRGIAKTWIKQAHYKKPKGTVVLEVKELDDMVMETKKKEVEEKPKKKPGRPKKKAEKSEE